MTVDESITIADFIEQQSIPSVGIAVAVNGTVVRKALWHDTVLKDGDDVLIISAVCGG